MARFFQPGWLFLLLLAGCEGCDGNGTGKPDDIGGDSGDDNDGDGYFGEDDCDDNNPDVHKGADEICNGIDDDCDDYVDDDDPGVDESSMYSWYTDRDGDAYGSDDTETLACEPPYANSVLDSGDCDDDDSSVNPGEVEICNDKDDDCDGLVDINAVDGSEYYPDDDGDSYGAEDSVVLLCDETEGYTSVGGDCDDGEELVNPGVAEACFNDIDDNCDGEIDDSCPNEVCGDITSDTTWTSEGFGYYVSCDISVLADLTIEPGTTVYFGPGTQMDVGVEGEGALIVDAGSKHVLFQAGVGIIYPSHELGTGEWTGLVIGPLVNTFTTVLDGLDIWHAGDDDGDGGLVLDDVDLPFTDGVVCMSGSDGIAMLNGASSEITDTTLCDNDGHGFYADDESGPESFSGNTLTGNGDFPVSVLFRYGGALEANTYEDHDDAVAYIEVRPDIVDTSVTLEGQDYPYYASGDVQIYGSGVPKLTLEDGVSMAFAYGAGLQIGARSSPGDFTVNGSGVGVEITAYDTSRGWDGITVEQGSDVVDIYGLEVSYGGNNNYGDLYLVSGSSGIEVTIESSKFTHSVKHGLYVGTSATPRISGSTFSHNTNYGIYIYDSSSSEGGLYVGGSASFVSNTLTDNASPIQVPASYVNQLDDSSSFTGNDEDLIVVTGSTIETTGTWQHLDADYSVTGDVVVKGSASPVITIEAGATLYMGDGVAFEVGDGTNGGMKTTGTTSAPVLFTSAASSPDAGDWDGLYFGSNTLSSTSLKGLAVEYGGGNGKGGVYIKRADPAFEDCNISNNTNSGVYVEGSATDTPEPSFSGCTFEDNEDDGVYVDSNSGLADFSDNTFAGNGGYPVSVNADYAGALDTGSSYKDTADDMVRILGTSLQVDSTWRHLDVPWYVPADITVSADLTVSAGSTVLFDSGASLSVGSLSAGSLTASGTSGSHITFTSVSDDPEAGDWDGLSLKSKCDSSTFNYVDVSYGNYGLYLDCSDTISVKNSSFSSASTYDLYCSSRATAVTWGSVTYSTKSGCTP